MPRQTEKDKAPDGYMTPRAAAEILGRSDQTIRNLVKMGKVDGTDVLTEHGERRYYISREAVENMGNHFPPPEEEKLPERTDSAERYILALETHNGALLDLLAEMRDQSASTSKRLSELYEQAAESEARERRLFRLTLLVIVLAFIVSGLGRTLLYVAFGV